MDGGFVQAAMHVLSSAVAAALAAAEDHATDLLKPAVCHTSSVCWAWDLAIAVGLARALTDMNVEAMITPEHGAARL
jgi:hypothetical protein